MTGRPGPTHPGPVPPTRTGPEMRILAISDEVVPTMWNRGVRRLEPDVVRSAGDLPFDYLEYLVSTLNVPLAFVPGNHDRDLSGITVSRVGLALRAGRPAREPGPAGALNVDGRCVDLGDLRVAGLGGSIRYRPGANQYTERQQARRARRLIRATRRLTRRDGRGVDVLLTRAHPSVRAGRPGTPGRHHPGAQRRRPPHPGPVEPTGPTAGRA